MSPSSFEWGDRVTVTGTDLGELRPILLATAYLIKIGGAAGSGGNLLAVGDWSASSGGDTVTFTAGYVYTQDADGSVSKVEPQPARVSGAVWLANQTEKFAFRGPAVTWTLPVMKITDLRSRKLDADVVLALDDSTENLVFVTGIGLKGATAAIGRVPLGVETDDSWGGDETRIHVPKSAITGHVVFARDGRTARSPKPLRVVPYPKVFAPPASRLDETDGAWKLALDAVYEIRGTFLKSADVPELGYTVVIESRTDGRECNVAFELVSHTPDAIRFRIRRLVGIPARCLRSALFGAGQDAREKWSMVFRVGYPGRESEDVWWRRFELVPPTVAGGTPTDRAPRPVQLSEATRTSAGDTAYALVAEARAAYREGSAEGFERSVLLFAEAQRLAQRAGDRRLLGLSLYGAGSAHAQLGRADSAIAYTRAALPLFRAAADRLGEASALGNMALSLKVTGYLDSALAYGREALALSRAIGDVRGEGIGLSTVASTFFDVGRADSAVAYFKAALPVWERYRSASSEAEAYAAQSEGQTLDNIGVTFIYRYLREPDSALRYMRRALAIWRGLGNRGAEGQTLLNIGYVFLTTANPDSALQYGRVRRDARADSALAYFRQALNLAREQGHAALENHARNNMIWPLVALGRSDEALALLRAALAGFRTQRDDFMVHGVQANMAAIYHRYATPPNFAAAVAYYDSAATWWHVARRRVGSEATTVRVTEQSIDSLEQWTLAALATHHAAPGRAALTSLSVTEHGRAQALLDLMRDTSRRAATRFGAEATDPSRALAYVRASGASVVEYLVARDTLIIWFSGNGRDELRVSRVPIGRDSLARLVRGWRAALGADDAGLQPRLAARSAPTLEPEARRGITSHAGDGDYRALGAKLAELLLPAELRQQVQTELVVVPHGVLGLVPFAALPFGPAGTALSDRVALRYGPSLAAVVFAEQRAGSRADPGRQTLAGSVVVGDPTMPAVLTESGKSARLAALAGAAAEAREVARRLGVTTLSGAAATEAEVRRRLSGAPVIHLATHGFAYASDARARLSFVALAPGEGHDGLLTVGEVLDEPALRLRADLVVLSACQTGLGDLKSAEGTVGLQRAFLAKGARSVLVTLWSVSDEATRLLMEKFYAHWLDDADKPSKAEALRRAQGDVRATKGFDHPRYWAAFQLVGAR